METAPLIVAMGVEKKSNDEKIGEMNEQKLTTTNITALKAPTVKSDPQTRNMADDFKVTQRCQIAGSKFKF
jgi:hypothetical protein